MAKTFVPRILLAFCAAFALQTARADTTFFSDNFSNGSTLDSTTPAGPTTNSASYAYASGKVPFPNPPSIASGDLRFGLVSSSSGQAEIQVLFSTNGVVLSKVGDYVQVAVVFTNTLGILTANSYLGLGLYNSGGSAPVAGGLLNTCNTANTDHVTDGVAGWQGYVGQIAYTAFPSRIMTRAAQTGTANNNQDLIASSSSTVSYANPSASTIGSASNSTVSLTVGQAYTDVVGITLVGTNSSGFPNSVAVTNTLYDSANTVLSQVGAVATNATYFTSAFDGLAMGWIQRTGGITTMVDVASITISGHVTIDTNPPVIISQPVSATAPTNCLVPFQVSATGLNNSYQWKRYSTNLVDGGSISGANTPTLIVSPTTTADFASGANGYYCTVANVNGSVDSTKVSLIQGTGANLVWNGNSPIWDFHTNASWNSPGVTFNYGDSVTFNDTGVGNLFVTMVGQYLSASSMTVNSIYPYDFSGSGSFAGPGSLKYIGSGNLTIENPNTYTGGTLISNSAAYVYLYNWGGLGSGPVTLAKAGGKIEVTSSGGATSGIQGDIVVADDFTIQFDGTGSYAGVMFGDLSGTSGKTLTFVGGNATNFVSRWRVYGNSTVYDGNLILSGPSVLNALYDGTVLAPYTGDGTQTYNGVISGNGGLVQRGSHGTTILNGPNTYAGGTTPTTGVIGLGRDSAGNPVTSGPIGTGPMYLAPEGNATGSGTIMASGGAHTIYNHIEYPSSTNNLTLIIGGTNNLTLAGQFTLNGDDLTNALTYTNRIIQVTNTAMSTISGVISDGGKAFGLTKTGNGILALTTTETYTGPTTVGGGMLLVNGALNAASSVAVTNGLLGGTGTIPGTVTATGGGLAPGNNAVGTLTINNSVTLGSGSSNVFEVNKTAGSRDLVNVSGAITYGGTLFATNLSGTVTTADSFQIFNVSGAKTGTFATIAGSPGPGLAWSFNPATGILGVVASVPTNPPPITITVTNISGVPNVQIAWPGDYQTWTLQTNSVGLAATNMWFAYPGSTTVTNVTIPVDRSRTNVFYRLTYTP